MVQLAAGVHVDERVRRYMVDIAEATRVAGETRLGASPRGSLALLRVARAAALSAGRNYVAPEDVQMFAVGTLAHRLVLAPEAELRGVRPEDVVANVVAAVPVPQGLPAA